MNKKDENPVYTYQCVKVDNLGVRYDIIDNLSETSKVSFGDAKATLVTPETFAAVVEELSNGEETFDVDAFKKRFGQETLIDFGC